MNTFKTFQTIFPEQITTLPRTERRRIEKLIIHCSAVGPNETSSARQIDAWHRAKGWQMIGYHYVIRRDGTIEIGRPPDMIGAHCKGHNSCSLGICYEGGKSPSQPPQKGGESPDGSPNLPKDVGNFQSPPLGGGLEGLDTRTPEQKTTLLALLRHLKTLYPNATIHGHNEFARKACPCFDARTEYAELQHHDTDDGTGRNA